MNSLEDKELLFVLANGEILQDTMSEWLRSRPAKAVGLPARVRISLVSSAFLPPSEKCSVLEKGFESVTLTLATYLLLFNIAWTTC